MLAVAALTNPRLNSAIGPVAALEPADRVTGPGATYALAPFAYPRPSRFGDGRAGVYYAARDLETAIAEVSYHRARFLARTNAPPMDLDERLIEAAVELALEDLRPLPASDPVYAPESYGASQDRARAQRAAGARGIVFASVRRSGGECVALFHPRDVRHPRTAGYVGLRWDGLRITDAYRKASLAMEYPR